MKGITSAMKNMLPLFLGLLLLGAGAGAQGSSDSLYHPAADAGRQVEEALVKAVKEQKHVMLMIGGNWCRWCKMFEKFRTTNAKVDSTWKKDYIWLHVNYSKENKNAELLKALAYPQRFGFPVFVVLDEKGHRLHTQNSALLEEGEGYSEEKVLEFFHHWRKEALNPEHYR